MKPLTPIPQTYTEVFDLCSSTYTKNNLKDRLQKVSRFTKDIDSIYRDHADGSKLSEFPKNILSDKGVSNEEFKAMYNDKLVTKKAIGRDVYMRIKNLCIKYENRCPSCAKRPVSTLDHFLPKSVFHQISILPLNLIPNCHDCNKIKDDYVSRSKDTELIHPYFDNIDTDQWLFARLVGKEHPVIEYEIIKPELWSDLLFERVKNHYKIYDLDSLYTSNAMTALNSHKNAFKNLRKQSDGIPLLKNHIRLIYNSFRDYNLNSWDTALFYALIKDENFHDSSFCT